MADEGSAAERTARSGGGGVAGEGDSGGVDLARGELEDAVDGGGRAESSRTRWRRAEEEDGGGAGSGPNFGSLAASVCSVRESG